VIGRWGCRPLGEGLSGPTIWSWPRRGALANGGRDGAHERWVNRVHHAVAALVVTDELCEGAVKNLATPEAIVKASL
jgi:hypothetical protein